MYETIYQGSTPTQEITLPIPTDLIKEAIVTYVQDDKIVFERKSPDGISFNGYDLVFKLTQEETGRVYDQAIDVDGAPFTYVETEEKIEQLLTEGEETGEM